jgi:hypothetical protein
MRTFISKHGSNPMAMQTIATTIDVGRFDGPGGTTGVGRAVAGAHYLMEVETQYVGLDRYSGRSTYYVGVVSEVTFPSNTIARTSAGWREDRRSVIGKKLHVCGVPICDTSP